MSKRKENLVWSIFLIIGLVFLSIAVILNTMFSEFRNNGGKTEALIYNINNGNVIVEYKVSGHVYKEVLNYYSDSMREGDSITIYYDLDNPANIKSAEMFIIVYVMGGLGGLFALLGFIFIIIIHQKSLSNKKLKETGMIIQADIDKVSMNFAYRINNSHPYNIICTYKHDGKIYIFKSDNIWLDIEPMIKNLNIKKIPVYVKGSDDYSKYYVDISVFDRYLGN